MKIAIIVGTRPEIIKLSPIMREYRRRKADCITIHTGQHYSYLMDKIFFDELNLPLPDYKLEIGSGTHAEQTARILTKTENIISKEEIDLVIVQGDTNTTLAGSLSAIKLSKRTAHIEAGLRSFDRSMPEEVNRIIADHISDLLFAPTETAKKNLLREGLANSRIFVTGNTIVDAVTQNLAIPRKYDVLKKLGLKSRKYCLITAHRQENVDNKTNLANILQTVDLLRQKLSLPVIFPLHPRTAKRVKEFGFKINPESTINPLGFLDFLHLEANSKVIITDSGGIQEEACILKVPCVTIRNNTERPETIEVGANILAGTRPSKVMNCVKQMMNRKINWKHPFGDGHSTERILKVLSEHCDG